MNRSFRILLPILALTGFAGCQPSGPFSSGPAVPAPAPATSRAGTTVPASHRAAEPNPVPPGQPPGAPPTVDAGPICPPQTLGWLTVTVRAAAVGRARLQQGGRTNETVLAVRLDVRNGHADKKLDFPGWQPKLPFGGRGATLADDRGNDYRLCNYLLTPEGHDDSGAIYPGESVTQILLFERPTAAARVLTLNLPCTDGDKEIAFRFTIPRDRVGATP